MNYQVSYTYKCTGFVYIWLSANLYGQNKDYNIQALPSEVEKEGGQGVGVSDPGSSKSEPRNVPTQGRIWGIEKSMEGPLFAAQVNS